MTAESFESTLNSLRNAVPFRIFTVELNTGERLEVDHRDAIVSHHGLTVFFSPGGQLRHFDNLSVNQIVAGTQHEVNGS